MKIENVKFGSYEDRDVIKYTLTNDNGVSISVLNFAGIWQAYMVPNNEGGQVNLLLGADNIEAYVNPNNAPLYVGRIVGRFGGRIAKGSSTLTVTATRFPLTRAIIVCTVALMASASSSTTSRLVRIRKSCR